MKVDQANDRTENHCLKLAEMRAGEQGTVLKILSSIGLKRRLEAMGIRPGVRIEKITGSPFSGPIVIRIEHIRLAIGYGMANKILVEVRRAITQ